MPNRFYAVAVARTRIVRARGAIHFARRSRIIRDPTSVRGPGDHDLRAPRGVAPGAARRARERQCDGANHDTRSGIRLHIYTRAWRMPVVATRGSRIKSLSMPLAPFS